MHKIAVHGGLMFHLKSLSLIIVSTLIISSITPTALAGPGGTGGGSGCRAEFMSVGYEFSLWLNEHGAKLQPQINGSDFLQEIDPNIIISTEENLTYTGSPVDAYWDGQKIKVRCDRFLNNNLENRRRVVAHEIFRKMKIEGDDYRISRQIWRSDKTTPFIEALVRYTEGSSIKSTQALGAFIGSGFDTTSQSKLFSFGCARYSTEGIGIIGCKHPNYFSNDSQKESYLNELSSQLNESKNIDYRWDYINGDFCLIETKNLNTCFRVNRGQLAYAIIDISRGAIIEAGFLE